MDHDTEQAKRLLQAHRELRASDQTFACLSSPFPFWGQGVFTYEEVNHVLAEAVERDEPVGIIKALVALGADVNFSRRRSSDVWSKVIRRQHKGQRNDLLLRATVRSRPETVHLLASHADQENLDSVLHQAIVREDLAVLKTLVDHGASPVGLHEDFQNAVFRDQVSILKVLLSGRRLPCLNCRSAGLRIAVKNGSLDVTTLLLKYWADVNHENAAPLLGAVGSSRPDLVAALVSGPVRPSPRSLDAAVGKIHETMGQADTQPEQDMLELCLSSGAAGPETTRIATEGLVEAVKRKRVQLLDIILRFTTPSGQYEAVALMESIRSGRIEVLTKLLEFSPSPTSLTVAISEAIKVDDTEVRHEVTKLLIDSGAKGHCTAAALVKVIQWVTADDADDHKPSTTKGMDRRLFRLLLNEGEADVNHGQGEALRVAIRSSCIELAEEILAKQPTPASVGAALPWALNTPDMLQKQTLVETLLRTQISEEPVGKALVDAFKDSHRNTGLIKLLLTRASVNYNNGEVFIFAIRNFDSALFRLLLEQDLGYKTLFTAVMEALKALRSERKIIFETILEKLQVDHLNTALKHVILESDTDLVLAKILLKNGAEPGHDDGVCIKHAACNLDQSTLNALSQYCEPNETLFTQVFASVTSRGRQWISQEHVELIQLLLRYGASGEVVDRAMVEVIDQLACQESQSDLADILLHLFLDAKANVNYNNGKSVVVAAERGDPFILSHLLRHCATSATASLAFSTAIAADHDESILLQLIDVFVDQRTTVPDVNEPVPGMLPPLLLCLKSYPDSVALLDSLVEAGCLLEATVLSQVYPGEVIKDREDKAVNQETEPVSPLMWALLQPDHMISSSVIESLIRRGANVSYTTPKTRATPLLLAAQSGRPEIVRSLLEAGAKISARDVLGRSALFFASRLGHVELAKVLLQHKPCANDGSLHEASRGFHLQVMQMLIHNGHDTNYRSAKHEGRTALGEMARNAAIEDLATAEEALEILCAADASPLFKVHGKTVIFLALDNQENESMTRMLLDRLLYRTLNSQENVFQQGIYHYSPTMYVAKGILLGPQSDALSQILKDHGAEDRFYASLEETQPSDAVGLPEEILEFERERRARERRIQQMEEEHAVHLRRELEKARNLGHIEDEHHGRDIRHREELTRQQLRLRGLEHNQVIIMKSEMHHNDVQIKTSEANLHSGIRWQHHNDDMSMISQKRDAKMQFRQRVHEQGLFEHAENEVLSSRVREHRQLQDSEFKERRHMQTLTHMQDSHRQKWNEKEAYNRQHLEFDGRQKIQDYVFIQRKNQLHRENLYEEDRLTAEKEMRARLHAHERHQMSMTELKTQRGNIIGQVNLGELRRWQESHGQAQKSIGGPVPETRVLTLA
ncbi:hypothetical protein B0H63DRAFT_552646 [Podospora didyma]|uniref:Ankyrin n=1 Tax=Podospora didyma TaxID=330526 RepID=A0AAE0K5P7_9PEZI|nr:hypothetical protein B0H63DRAFT_552646 [Podospora didyma]